MDDALNVLQSDASARRKSEACIQLRAALAEYPHDAPGRSVLLERAARLAAAALREPPSRLEAGRALVAIGPPAYEPLFTTVLETEGDTQAAATSCLIGMSNTVVPVLIPALLGDDFAAQERAVRILTRMGSPVSEILRSNYAKVLEPFAGFANTPGTTDLSMRGKSGVLAFARLFAAIGDRPSVLALLEGAETLHRRHPDVAAAHLRIIDGLGREAVDRLSTSQRLNYERLRLLMF